LPQSKIPNGALPVENYISNYISYERKLERRDLRALHSKDADPKLLAVAQKART
jgi:hypothetical protein